jgi:hypothetical protein
MATERTLVVVRPANAPKGRVSGALWAPSPSRPLLIFTAVMCRGSVVGMGSKHSVLAAPNLHSAAAKCQRPKTRSAPAESMVIGSPKARWALL